MKIKILVPDSGPAGTRNIGDVVDVAKDEGERLIAAGRAELVRSAKKAEKAVK